jgi:prepilin-type processing-associated H-X9-DG protein
MARSRHPGGVNVSFVDGSVHFVSETINVDTWRALGSRNGNEVTRAMVDHLSRIRLVGQIFP